ncbi:MAG: ABC transporter ATP-binding protein [Peptoniphilaceae bacterium]|nr:ABC transporter ATP-binding protein [Peptoniphilaceae bacterium]MDY6018613.1 ABC transporter ATP-binding protein [Anaerococcus sp.]
MENKIKITNLNKSYLDNHVLCGVDLELNPGEILGLVGTNGAGKTTLMSIILGLKKNYTGDIYIDGVNLKNVKRKTNKKLGCLIENPGLYSNLTGYQNLQYFLSFVGKGQVNNIDYIIEKLQLNSFINKKVKKYSLGMKQRLGIGIALLGEPDYLILDEPMSGIDAEVVPVLRNTLKELTKEKNIGIMVSSHVLSEIELLCDRVAILRDGIIIDNVDLNKQGLISSNNYIISARDIGGIKKYLISNNYLVKDYGHELLVMIPDGNSEELLRRLFMKGYSISSLIPYKEKLEDRFIKAIEEI